MIAASKPPSKYSWTDIFHVPFGTRKFLVGKRPGQGTYSIRLEYNKRPIVRALGTTDATTAKKNALNVLHKIFNTDWETQERDRKLARRKTISEAWELYGKKFSSKGPSQAHLATFEGVFKPFKARFGSRFIGDVRAADIDDYLSEIGNSNSRAKHFTYLFGFWRWAERLEHVADNPMRRLDRPSTTPRRNILTPAQMKEILDAQPRMHDWMFAAMLLGAFAGVRTAEICRMRWEDVDGARDQIDIREAKKTDKPFAERIVDITDPIRRRLGIFTGKSGSIIPRASKQTEKAVEAWFCTERAKFVAGVLGWETWPENCLRHSFATYHLAACANPAATAFQMGHSSPRMVEDVYAVPAKRVVAGEWWSL